MHIRAPVVCCQQGLPLEMITQWFADDDDDDADQPGGTRRDETSRWCVWEGFLPLRLPSFPGGRERYAEAGNYFSSKSAEQSVFCKRTSRHHISVVTLVGCDLRTTLICFNPIPQCWTWMKDVPPLPWEGFVEPLTLTTWANTGHPVPVGMEFMTYTQMCITHT